MAKIKLSGFTAAHVPPSAPPPLEDILPAEADIPMFRTDAEAEAHATRVLIVDDDPVFLNATTMLLNSAGFQVATASESSSAIAALGEQPIDFVLMDVQFPPDVSNGGMGSWDGFQILHWMRGLPCAKNTRFIMVSNSDSASLRGQAEQLGAIAYLQKPLDTEELFAILRAG